MSSKEDKVKGRVLLPSSIIPERYDIKLKPDLEAFTFTGEETVLVSTSPELEESCKEIKMHAKELCFVSASLKVVKTNGKDVEASAMDAEEIRMHLKSTTVTFVFPEAIPANSVLEVRIEFNGFLNNQMAGFYRSSYNDIHGNSKIMASTQFEALDARRAFPCWDEPSRKAVFGISLVVPIHLTAMSNMPEERCQTLACGRLKDITYLDTPVMSTYLVAMVVGEFDYVQAQTEHGVLVKVYTTPGRSHTGTFALDCAVRCLDLYDDFFGVPYPLPKLDMVGVPEFAMGAMENWGLVTYREVDVCVDPVKASFGQKRRVCTVVTHELAHQWFGNLVTMAWWDDLWLNEGFASWTECYAADKLFPEWKMWEQFVTGHLNRALRLDALKSSHPIQVPIRHAEEVEEVFDAISYCKGGSVVRMIAAVLGKDAFQKGLVTYMKRHAYGNTETFDLWKAWEESSGLPVGEMMKSWTEQMGFPLLQVLNETWEDHQLTLELSQDWFLSDGSALSDEDQQKQWCVPILTSTSAGPVADMMVMREKTATITIPLSSPDAWVKLNANQEVPLRVNCSPTMLERLSKGIVSGALSPSDRVGLLADSYALVKAGKMNPKELIRLLSCYTNEQDTIVWEGIETTLLGLDTVLSDDETMSANFRAFAKKLLLNLEQVVAWDPNPTTDGPLAALLRGLMVRLLVTFSYDDPNVLAQAKTRFAKFQEDPNDVNALPSDMRTSVFKIILKNGGQHEYDQVLSYYSTASDNAEKKFVLTSIGTIPDRNLKQRTMEWTISGAIKLQDFFYPMMSVGSSRVGREVSWNFLQEHLNDIKAMIGKASPSLMDGVINCCCGGFCSQDKATEIEHFFKSNPLPSSARTITQLVENIRSNANFLDTLRKSDLNQQAFWDAL